MDAERRSRFGNLLMPFLRPSGWRTFNPTPVNPKVPYVQNTRGIAKRTKNRKLKTLSQKLHPIPSSDKMPTTSELSENLNRNTQESEESEEEENPNNITVIEEDPELTDEIAMRDLLAFCAQHQDFENKE